VNGALITSASPAFIVIFAALILHEKLTWQRIAAVTLATIGVMVIINPAEADFGSDTFAGDVALAVAALTWGLYSVLVRAISAETDTLTLTILCFIGGLALTIPAAGVELTQNPLGDIGIGIVLGVLYLGVISTAAAMWLWNRAFALVDASAASLFFFAQPVVGAGLGVLLLDQPLTVNLLGGALLIALGVMLSMLAPARTHDESGIRAEVA
jgi:drug/metabolite transporter (DMT)-like permease